MSSSGFLACLFILQMTYFVAATLDVDFDPAVSGIFSSEEGCRGTEFKVEEYNKFLGVEPPHGSNGYFLRISSNGCLTTVALPIAKDSQFIMVYKAVSSGINLQIVIEDSIHEPNVNLTTEWVNYITTISGEESIRKIKLVATNASDEPLIMIDRFGVIAQSNSNTETDKTEKTHSNSTEERLREAIQEGFSPNAGTEAVTKDGLEREMEMGVEKKAGTDINKGSKVKAKAEPDAVVTTEGREANEDETTLTNDDKTFEKEETNQTQTTLTDQSDSPNVDMASSNLNTDSSTVAMDGSSMAPAEEPTSELMEEQEADPYFNDLEYYKRVLKEGETKNVVRDARLDSIDESNKTFWKTFAFTTIAIGIIIITFFFGITMFLINTRCIG